MQLQTLDSMQFIQIDANNKQEPLIDSRIYCRDIIKVNHSDWFQNILKKHKNHIEQEFGVLRLFNGKTQNNVKGGRPERYALMTGAQTRFALLLSNNDPEVLMLKAQLLKEFEQAQKWQKEYLERQLTATPQDTTELDALKAKNENLKAEVKQIEKRWERFAEEIQLTSKLREYNTKLHNENCDLKTQLQWRANDITKLKKENEDLKSEVKRLLADLETKFSKNKPLKENLELHRKLNKLRELQEECFLTTKQVRAFLSDFEDITENGIPYNHEALVEKLVAKIKPKLYKAYDLNVAENNLLEVDIDWDKIIDERRKPENRLF